MHPIQTASHTNQTGPSTAGSEIRVLFVEDSSNFAALAQRYLESEPNEFDIEHVTHPADALEQLSTDPDCIVSGYRMPGMTGIELLKTVRETHPTLPFILFTARHQRAVASEAISAGVTEYAYLEKGSGTDHFTDLATLVRNAVLQRDANPALVTQNTPS